jgi:acetyl esterase/lipase
MLKGRTLFQQQPPPPVTRVENLSAPGPAGAVPLRLYAQGPARTRPVLLFMHGGGWVIGDLDTHDDPCRRLALDSGCLVIAVDYRLAPEHRYPAAVDDAWAALRWVAAHAAELGGDPARLAVGGDSAGGNLAAALALRARDAGGPALAYQLLVYPAVDCDLTRPSVKAHGEGYLLTAAGMRWFWDHYQPDPALRTQPLASPLRAESLAGLPPAWLLLPEYDVLLDEGEAYAARLQAEGVPVTVRRYAGAMHAFFNMSAAAIARQAIADAAQALRAALRP